MSAFYSLPLRSAVFSRTGSDSELVASTSPAQFRLRYELHPEDIEHLMNLADDADFATDEGMLTLAQLAREKGAFNLTAKDVAKAERADDEALERIDRELSKRGKA